MNGAEELAFTPTRTVFSEMKPTGVTNVYKYKNEVRCRDDTVPKTVDTRKHCKVGLRTCNNLPQPQDVGRWLRKIVACSQPYLAVPSCTVRSQARDSKMASNII